jgi:hypothetical protein
MIKRIALAIGILLTLSGALGVMTSWEPGGTFGEWRVVSGGLVSFDIAEWSSKGEGVYVTGLASNLLYTRLQGGPSHVRHTTAVNSPTE